MEKRSIVSKTAIIFLTGLLSVLVLPPFNTAYAGAGTALRPVRSVGGEGGVHIDVRPEACFDLVGRLNAIDAKKVVIDDRKLERASGLHASGVKRWHLVGVKLNPAGQVVQMVTISDEPN